MGQYARLLDKLSLSSFLQNNRLFRHSCHVSLIIIVLNKCPTFRSQKTTLVIVHTNPTFSVLTRAFIVLQKNHFFFEETTYRQNKTYHTIRKERK